MEKIIEDIRKNWNDREELMKILLEIVIEYKHQAEVYASAVIAEASTFNAEMVDAFKPSVTKAEYRAKEYSGGTKILAEREMKALEFLYDLVQTVISSSFKK